jgi:phosphotransferase family enzyme
VPPLDELIGSLASGRPVERAAFTKNADSLSGSPFESLRIGTEAFVIKHLSAATDWLMRALDDGVNGEPPYAYRLWRSGVLDRMPDCIDHAIVGMSHDGDDLAIVMRDVSETLVPTGSDPIPLEQHRRFIDHMARVHAAFWEFEPAEPLLSDEVRFGALSPRTAAREADRAADSGKPADPVPGMLAGGWVALRAAGPGAGEQVEALAMDAAPLARALRETPATFVHGDWKFGNLGSHPDGRTVLLDWAWTGRTGPFVDLGWYLAVNCDRLPESKEATIEALRDRLEAAGVATAGWWERQVELGLLGGFTLLGWSKAGDPKELAWWIGRITPTLRELTR